MTERVRSGESSLVELALADNRLTILARLFVPGTTGTVILVYDAIPVRIAAAHCVRPLADAGDGTGKDPPALEGVHVDGGCHGVGTDARQVPPPLATSDNSTAACL